MKRFKGPFAVLLCLSLLGPSASSVAQPASERGNSKDQDASKHQYPATQLQGDARILHALNRFTFGPRPGDLAAVRAMGLEKWFNRQLHPGAIDEAELDSRLSLFPAMREAPQELLFSL